MHNTPATIINAFGRTINVQRAIDEATDAFIEKMSMSSEYGVEAYCNEFADDYDTDMASCEFYDWLRERRDDIREGIAECGEIDPYSGEWRPQPDHVFSDDLLPNGWDTVLPEILNRHEK